MAYNQPISFGRICICSESWGEFKFLLSLIKTLVMQSLVSVWRVLQSSSAPVLPRSLTDQCVISYSYIFTLVCFDGVHWVTAKFGPVKQYAVIIPRISV